MRICYVAHSCSHFVAPYVDYFAAQGHDVHLVSLHQQNLPNATNYHPLKREVDPQTDKFSYFLAIPAARRMIRQIKADVVHAHYLTSNGVLAAMSGCRPLVVTAHGSDVHQSVREWFRRVRVRYVLKRADLVNPVSGDLERQILAWGVPPERIVPLTLGVDVKRYFLDRAERRPGPVRLICTRNMFPVYRCDQIVRALGGLARQNTEFEFTFAGTGPLLPELQALAKDVGLDDRVRFLGGYRLDDLPALLGDADVYVSASAWDGTSLSLLEGLASGAFPVVSDIPANREWLTGSGDGLLFDPDNAEQLADCLTRAIRDAELRQRVVEPNRQLALARGDRETNMARLAQHYERLVATPC